MGLACYFDLSVTMARELFSLHGHKFFEKQNPQFMIDRITTPIEHAEVAAKVPRPDKITCAGAKRHFTLYAKRDDASRRILRIFGFLMLVGLIPAERPMRS
jgi:hypothetical protein